MDKFARQPASIKIAAFVLVLLAGWWVIAFLNARNAANPGITAANAPQAQGTPVDEHAGHDHAPGAHPEPEAATAPTEAPATTSSTESTPTTANTPAAAAESVTELQIEDIQVGTGTEAAAGDNVTVHYRGTLTDGTQFDASYDRGEPFSFPLGGGQVIQGWDQGVAGMREGGKRKLTIPPHLGYGEQGAGNTIPPNATLVFEVELLKVEK